MTISLVTVHPFDPWGSKIGGIENFIRSMLLHAPDDFQLTLIGMTESPDQRPVGQWSSLPLAEKPISFYPLAEDMSPHRRRWIPLSLRFSWLLRNVPLQFSDSVLLYHRIEPLAWARMPAKANLLCVHGDPREMVGPASEVRWRFFRWGYRITEAAAVRRARRVFVVSRSGLRYFRQRYAEREEDFSFLPTGYRDDYFFLPSRQQRTDMRAEVLRKYGLDPSFRYLLFVGRWERQKNPLPALDTLQCVSAFLPDVHLLLVGEGSLKREMERHISQIGVETRVHWLGPLPSPQLAEAMRAGILLLATSEFEGMSITWLEAHACGLPIVSTDVGEVREIIKDGITGKIIPTNDPHRLAQGVMDILDHPDAYPPEACAEAVKDYRCQTVLRQFYEQLREMAQPS